MSQSSLIEKLASLPVDPRPPPNQSDDVPDIDTTDLQPVLESIARTGSLPINPSNNQSNNQKITESDLYNWHHVRSLLLIRIINEMNKIMKQSNNQSANQSNGHLRDSEPFEVRWNRIQASIQAFETGPPFTLQRLAELAINHSINQSSNQPIYQNPHGYLLALSKCVCGISAEWRDDESDGEEDFSAPQSTSQPIIQPINQASMNTGFASYALPTSATQMPAIIPNHTIDQSINQSNPQGIESPRSMIAREIQSMAPDSLSIATTMPMTDD